MLAVVGEDDGEGASVIQERTHAYALKWSLVLFDPRPDLPTMVRMVETVQVAETVRFELTEELPPRQFSRLLP